MTVVCAAGNSQIPLGTQSFVNVPGVIVVGAVDINGKYYPNNNYGPQISIFAPGVDIEGAHCGGDDQYKSEDGTSGACALVSGVTALIMQKHNVSGARVAHMLYDSARSIDIPGKHWSVTTDLFLNASPFLKEL